MNSKTQDSTLESLLMRAWEARKRAQEAGIVALVARMRANALTERAHLILRRCSARRLPVMGAAD